MKKYVRVEIRKPPIDMAMEELLWGRMAKDYGPAKSPKEFSGKNLVYALLSPPRQIKEDAEVSSARHLAKSFRRHSL